jgi:hypothetical protein
LTTVVYLRIDTFGNHICRVRFLGSILKTNKTFLCIKDGIRIRRSDRLSVTISLPTLNCAAEHFASSVGDDLCAYIFVEHFWSILVSVGSTLSSIAVVRVIRISKQVDMRQHIVSKFRKHFFVRTIVSDLVVDQFQQFIDLFALIGTPPGVKDQTVLRTIGFADLGSRKPRLLLHKPQLARAGMLAYVRCRCPRKRRPHTSRA